MSKLRDRAKKTAELQLALQHVAVPVQAARSWLAETPHRAGCQCHRCFWAHGVIAGRIKVDFDSWRRE